ncbi:MAG TPA: hypothetical protein PLL78_12695 [Fimbriimonadaceae bacterium]|nr:hypothetical protein [Fimbriimonadaceae bacterium]HRJ97536.1 hypothetical protein [Fimbriimonadaceae bacterium]
MQRKLAAYLALSTFGCAGLTAVIGSRAESQPNAKALVQLQATSPGTAQSGHVNVSGTGLFGTRVGIGTASPADPLSIAASGYGMVHTSGGTTLGTFADATGGWLGTRSVSPLLLFTGNGPARLTIATSGNVGIGTTAPTSLLTVAGNARVDGLTLPTGAAAGRVLTSDASGIASWQTVAGFSLPFSANASVNGPALQIINASGSPGSALRGEHPIGFGVHGKTVSGYGVFGESTDAAAFTSGVWGQSASTSGRGVVGYATASSGSSYGVVGQSDSTTGAGVYGYVGFGSLSSGVIGRSDAANGVGVRGVSTNGSTSAGVYGESAVGYGVYGYHTATTGGGDAVYGNSLAANGSGVVGLCPGTGNAYGVYGAATTSATAWGVYSLGRLGASGTKSFHIDHPLDPENKYLNHYCTEGEAPLNVYRGNVVLDPKGMAIVRLPEYFDEINRDPSYQLTPIGRPAPNLYVAREIEGRAFAIAGGNPGQRVSWRVEAIRNDRFVRENGAPVEVEKPDVFKGTYLQPELYGQPADRAERPPGRSLGGLAIAGSNPTKR